MKITAGHLYKTRSGEIVGPVAWDDACHLWRRRPDFVRNTGDYWHEDGMRMAHVEDDLDLVEEIGLPESNGDR
jgi:hypothetical protein